MRIRFIDPRLVESTVAQGGDQLIVGFTTGPSGQHGHDGGDAQRGEEDVLPGSSLGIQTFVECKAEVSIGMRQYAAGLSMIVVVVVVVVVVLVVVVVVVVVCPGYSQQQCCKCATSNDTTHLYSLSRETREG